MTPDERRPESATRNGLTRPHRERRLIIIGSVALHRTSLASYEPGGEGECTTASVPVVESSAFDGADRIIDVGYTYDVLGRTRAVPAGDTSDPAGGAVSVTYHADDMVASLAATTVGGVAKSKSFTLDPAGRLSGVTDTEDAVEVRQVRNHYASHAEGSDNPAWIGEQVWDADAQVWLDTWSRNITTPAGDLGLIQSDGGSVLVNLANLHGDV